MRPRSVIIDDTRKGNVVMMQSYRLTRADSRIFERSRPPGVYVNGFGPPGRPRLLARAAGIVETS